MGFRGEAMASMAAIAQIELKTKPHSKSIGTRIIIEGSEIKEQESCATTNGTSIAIKNLFYNVPARRKFLKSDQVELKAHYRRISTRCACSSRSEFEYAPQQ